MIKKIYLFLIIMLVMLLSIVFTACIKVDENIEIVTGIQISNDYINLVWNKVENCDKYIVCNNGKEIKQVTDNRISLQYFDDGINNITISAVIANKKSLESETYIYVDKGSDGVTYTLQEESYAYKAEYNTDQVANIVAIQSIYNNKPVKSVYCNSANKFIIPDIVENIEGMYIDGNLEDYIIRLPKNLQTCDFYSISKGKGYSISKENQSFAVLDGVIYSKDMSTLIDYPAYKRELAFVFPDDTKYIGDKIFESYYLKDIDFNNALTWKTETEEDSFDSYLLNLEKVENLTIPDTMKMPKQIFIICQNITISKNLILPDILIFVGQQNVYFEAGRKEISSLLFSLGSKGKTMNIYLPLSLEKIIHPEGADWEGVFGTFKNTLTVNIYCEADSKPKDWCNNWHVDCYPIWGYKI